MKLSALLLLSFLFVAVCGFSQEKKPAQAALKSGPGTSTPAVNQQFDLQEKIYKRSRQLGDLITATQALHTMLVLKPERFDLNDSLCLIYLGRGLFQQSKKVSEEILERNSGNLPVREVLAQSLENLGAYNEALAAYEILYKETEKLLYLYKVAAFQYLLKRYGECDASLRQIELSPEAPAEKVVLNYPNENPNFQKVPILAAAMNIRGVIAMDMNKPTEAGQYFDQALTMMPDFIMAKKNKERLSGK